MNSYINNLETNKIELHFEKSEYMSLPDNLKQELRRHFLFSKSIPAWVSRSTQNHYWAIETAKKLGFTEEVKKGTRLSYAEQLERKAERAEVRAERYDTYSENASKRGDQLQSTFKPFHGDISFFSQPNINSSRGRAFTNFRNRVFERYGKSFEEYRKSEYFENKAATARATADMVQLENPVYLDNRIKECNATIRKLEKNIVLYEEEIESIKNGEKITSYNSNKPLTIENYEKWIDETLEKIDFQVDKLGFFENCNDKLKEKLKEVGKKIFTKDDIKPGYYIRTRFQTWAEVTKVNPKTVTALYRGAPLDGLGCNPPYAEIREVKIPEGWTEKGMEIKNPFSIGDILTRTTCGNNIIRAFQVVNSTNKTITIQEIKVEDNKPLKGSFKSEDKIKRTVKKDRGGTYVVNDTYGDWYLYKYIPKDESVSA